MIVKESKFLAVVIVVQIVFVFSNVLVHTAIAISPLHKVLPGNALNEYTSFKKCLSQAEGTKGFATSHEIKNCYNPIYHPLSASCILW